MKKTILLCLGFTSQLTLATTPAYNFFSMEKLTGGYLDSDLNMAAQTALINFQQATEIPASKFTGPGLCILGNSFAPTTTQAIADIFESTRSQHAYLAKAGVKTFIRKTRYSYALNQFSLQVKSEQRRANNLLRNYANYGLQASYRHGIYSVRYPNNRAVDVVNYPDYLSPAKYQLRYNKEIKAIIALQKASYHYMLCVFPLSRFSQTTLK